MGDVFDRIQAAADRLTAAERKVAESVTSDPQAVAVGTVADIAARSGSSGASVVRLATKLGYSGFSGLQSAVQTELGRRLRPATERIRDPKPNDLLGHGTAAALGCVQDTMASVEPADVDAIVRLLSNRSSAVWVVAGDASSGIAHQFATELSMLRPLVSELSGSPVNVARQLADVSSGDVLVALDLRRYDRWVLDAVTLAAEAGATVVSLTDGPLSPLAAGAAHVVTVEAEGIGPFDNYVGALAMLATITAGVAIRLRATATAHLDGIERAWRSTDALVAPTGDGI